MTLADRLREYARTRVASVAPEGRCLMVEAAEAIENYERVLVIAEALTAYALTPVLSEGEVDHGSR